MSVTLPKCIPLVVNAAQSELHVALSTPMFAPVQVLEKKSQ
jgi:hypothetical protein